HRRVAMLLAFPSSPGRYLVPPRAFDGLTAAAKLDGSMQERTTLLPITYARTAIHELEDGAEDLRRWAEESSVHLDERVLRAAERALAAGWTLVGITADQPAPP